ncbi:MYC1 protein [Rhizoctonia solani AG-1 IA]|uniref:MYC1 protein n=1 Tax=Thanatephorus cucumeris (strain AG1-IA) TaxID=983506 RepID=L8WR85_THACA|nr:MYC1 protein [Rhizoctonia solani AG-1 IA]
MDYLDGGDEDDFEYSGEESDQGADADVENQYYTAKALKEDDPSDALKALRKIIDAEKDKKEYTDWGFKALKQSTKISFQILAKPDDALETYTELLGYTRSAVTRNYSEKTINGILDYVGGQKPLKKGQKKANPVVPVETLEKFYEVTKSVLIETKNEVCPPITSPTPQTQCTPNKYTRLLHVISELHRSASSTSSTSAGDDTSDQSRGTLLLEIYALEIQMYNETKNWKKLKEIYNKSSEVRSAIPHPRIMGVIKECGGKMWMGESGDLFALSFPGANDQDRTVGPRVLLSGSKCSNTLSWPTCSWVPGSIRLTVKRPNREPQHSSPILTCSHWTRYKSDPQITAMTDLVGAYQRREVHEAERILRGKSPLLFAATLIYTRHHRPQRHHHGRPLYRILHRRPLAQSQNVLPHRPHQTLHASRTRVPGQGAHAYTFLFTHSFKPKREQQLNVEKHEVEELLIGLILEGKVEGKIDQVAQRLEITKTQPLARRRYAALDKWTGALENLNGAISGKVISGAGDARGEFERMGALMICVFMERKESMIVGQIPKTAYMSRTLMDAYMRIGHPRVGP